MLRDIALLSEDLPRSILEKTVGGTFVLRIS